MGCPGVDPGLPPGANADAQHRVSNHDPECAYHAL